MKKPTIPHLIFALYVLWAIMLVYTLTRATKYELNGVMPGSDYIHSEIQP